MGNGVYCRKSGQVARAEGEVCSGSVLVKGDGVLPVDDEFGVPYVRKCVFATDDGEIIVSREASQVVISNCVSVNSK